LAGRPPAIELSQVLINTAKLHSELFKKFSTQLLYQKTTADIKTHTIVSRKRKEARKRRPKRPVFDKLDNIYRPRAYKPKMMAAPLVEKPLAEQNVAEWSENLNMTAMCKDCKEFPPNLVEEFSSGDLVCGSCGLVIGDRIVDTRSEWRTFANDDGNNDDPSRVGDGANPLLNGSQLATSIAYGDGSRSHDLHRAHGRSTADKATKSLLAAYKEIGAHCDAVNIPKNVSDTAKHLYKLVDDAKAFKGKSQEAIIAGCIFIACRQCGVPRTFREIYALTKVSKKDIGRTFKALEKFFAEDSKEKVSVTVGGKSNVLDVNVYSVLTVFVKGPKTNTRPPPPRMLRISASAIAVNLASRASSSRFPKGSLTRCPPSVISPVDLLCQSQLPASTWRRICSASQSPPKISRALLALAMVPFAQRISTSTRNGRDSLSLSGLQMARATWITFQSGDG
jgi:hypothetical protein